MKRIKREVQEFIDDFKKASLTDRMLCAMLLSQAVILMTLGSVLLITGK